ncbi:hypothetical protein GGTG_00507 [Gaeumannomyces tritici R3-111a-1]|uniref:Peptidase S33 tripeptidyl aminopeptidase-like C-terminal domain-containing protein n=1 Tax=Gaeumannomyces tritici (strain R3-111a-1) TaxID=644352 RepID=J3NGX1_GAET3|nr:hypothetical protein GGTG_00507 [Gaeumannomyces tritici R3-111a-1]EJT80511.1 hypothetical protein GGTG_00507 [Gaeumannomyces tritici R3-111a-1]
MQSTTMSQKQKDSDLPHSGGSAVLRWRRLTTVAAAVLIASFCLWQRSPTSPWPSFASPKTPSDGYTDWDAIAPSEKLSWVPCFRSYPGDFLCARLTVPMDWNRPLNASAAHPKVHIAMVMLPGDGHSLESGRFAASPVIMNPGGPGGSGTSAMLSAGLALQAVVGRHHDLLSFDPRGIGATWPQADCFLDDFAPEDPPTHEERNAALLRRLTSKLETQVIGLANSTDRALALTTARARAQSKLCKAKDGPDSIFRYVGTPNVARDLLAIVNAWDAWTDTLGAVAARPEQPSEDTRGKLVYWGLSYGTVLGATFASMFPNSVGRLVLDGVMKADMYSRDVWADALADTDSVLASFFGYCHDAQERCYFYRKGDGPEAMAARYKRLMARLEEDPIIVIPNQVRMPMLLRASDLKTAVFGMLYFPVATFPTLSLLLFIIESGLDLSQLVVPPNLAPVCSATYAPVPYPEDSQLAIMCSDRRHHWKENLADLQVVFEELARVSAFSDFWMLIMATCAGWNIDPVDPPEFNLGGFPGPDSPPVNTSFPVFFVSNTYDPVTPLEGGLAMSRRFAGSGFLELQASGHCTLAAVSLCTIAKIRAYLDRGLVPDPPVIDPASISGSNGGRPTGRWETCESNEKPWKPFDGRTGHLGISSLPEPDVVAAAWQQVQQTFRKHVGSHLPTSPLLGTVLDMDASLAADLFEKLKVGPAADQAESPSTISEL